MAEYSPKQEFKHLVVAALEKHRGFHVIPLGIKCNGCSWTSLSGNKRKQFTKHQGWAITEEFEWED